MTGSLRRVLVVGAGLIGTSVGLALGDAGVDVVLVERDPQRRRLAVDLGAGRGCSELDAAGDGFDIVLACVPPGSIAAVIAAAQDLNLGRMYSDTGSIKALPQAEAEKSGVDMRRFAGGHPVAGRERGGPGSARSDLFLGRPWVICPTPTTDAEVVESLGELARACGAVPAVMDAAAHDAAMAVVSHAPQALASLLADRLRTVDDPTAALAGSGLRDLTRIADSDPDLWAQIAAGNAGPLADVLGALAERLAGVVAELRDESRAAEAFRRLVADGNAGRERLPGKHGSAAAPYVVVPVVIADEPGTLARLLGDAGAAGINVEDLSLEHSPGAPVGLCELVVRPDQAEALAAVLAERGWTVHAPAGGR